jgi:hypothetical protein
MSAKKRRRRPNILNHEGYEVYEARQESRRILLVSLCS